MDALVPIAILTAVAVISPGPNNFVVLARSANGGIAHAVPAILGILAGTSAMMATALWAMHAFDLGIITQVAARVGGLVLAAMAVVMWREAGKPQTRSALLSPVSLALFQFANPKAWITASTVAASGAIAGVHPGAVLMMTAVISMFGLSTWALGGAMLSTWLTNGRRRQIFEHVLAAALLVSALTLIFL